MSGARTITASATRTRGSSTMSSTRRRKWSASTCRPTPTACLSVTDHCLRSRNYVNVVVAGKQPAPQWLTMDEAIKHCEAGLGIWEWASNDRGAEPDVVMACCGDVPTLETLAAVDLLRRHAPELKIRVINVVDLMTLQPPQRASARAAGRRFRRAVHDRQADHLRLPRLSLADPPADLSPQRPQEPACARLQGRGHDEHPVRHVRDERHRPVPSGRRRDRSRAEARRPRRLCQAGDPRQADRAQAVHRPLRRRHARDRELELGPGGRPGVRHRARARPRRTTSDRGGRHERLRDPARRDRLEPERPAYRHDRYPADRQRAPSRRDAAPGAGQGELCSRPRQPDAARPRDLRAGRARRPGRRRTRSDGVELRRVRGADDRADPRSRGRAGWSSATGARAARRRNRSAPASIA